MLVTLSGISMLARLVQSLNAKLPMLVTLSGISMLVRLVQSLNAYLLILLGLPMNLTVAMLVRLSYHGASS